MVSIICLGQVCFVLEIGIFDPFKKNVDLVSFQLINTYLSTVEAVGMFIIIIILGYSIFIL